MQKAFWYFINKSDSNEIRFQGTAVQAEAFWETLKKHCDGDWVLQLERSMNALMQAQSPERDASAAAQPVPQAQAAPVSQAASIPPAERTRTLSFDVAPERAQEQIHEHIQDRIQVQAAKPAAAPASHPEPMTRATALRTLSIEMPLSDASAEMSPVATPVASAAAVIATDPAGTVSLSLQPLETSDPQTTSAPPTLFSTALPSGKRKYARYALPFRVILTSGKNSFRTYSSNISVGGMLLKNPLPRVMLEGACRIFIGRTTSPENIELTCQLAGDAADPCRVRFLESDSAKLKKLEQWVLEALQGNRAA